MNEVDCVVFAVFVLMVSVSNFVAYLLLLAPMVAFSFSFFFIFIKIQKSSLCLIKFATVVLSILLVCSV